MSQQQPRIFVRAPPHRDFLQGYPGIPASDPAKDPPPSKDPLFQLPHLLRPQAHLSGTVEIRSPPKGPPIRAKWLSLELEKIESIPPQTYLGSHGVKSNDRDKDKTNKEGRFVELIGLGPSKLWVAGEDQGATFVDEIDTPVVKKRGFKGIPFKKNNPNDEDEEDGFDLIPDGNYPFKIPLPEGLPPTTDVDSKSSGISYQLVASLCVKGKKGILKGSSKPTILLASASIILHKADILPVFPAYHPILSPPIHPKLPWAVPGELTIGEARESNLTIRRGFGGGPGDAGGELSMTVTRKGSAFGPGDLVPIFVELVWSGTIPIRLTRLDFVLRETITFRHPSPNNPAYLVRSTPRVNSIFTSNANVSPDANNPSAFAVLYKDESSTFELTGTVPTSHLTRVTVRTAKHIEVAYHLKIRAMIEGGDEIAVDNWPVVISNVNARSARGIVADIGYVQGLCDRPGLPNPNNDTDGRGSDPTSPDDDLPLSNLASRNFSAFAPPPPPPVLSATPQVESPAAYSDVSTEKRRLLEARTNGTSTFHVSNPTFDQRPPDRSTPVVSTPERPAPLRPTFAPSPTAEEEKRRYYEAATRSRDTLQGFRPPDSPSPVSTDTSRYRGTSDGPTFSPTSSTAPTEPPVSPFAYHEASVLKITRPSQDDDRTPSRTLVGLGNAVGISRSNTTLAASGSQVSTTLDDRSLPPPPPAAVPVPTSSNSLSVGATLLGRSLTSAESEKKRLFLEAKEMARIRQEEARLELERQNKVLEDFEFEEAQRDFEERLIFEAEELARKRQVDEREQFEQRLERERVDKLEQFEREQREAQERRQAETDRWARERKEEDEMKKRRAEELRRMDEQKEREETERRSALARKAEMERQRAEDEQRRLAGERARREEDERRYRAEQEEGEEERRRQDNERRLREEYERRINEEEHRRRIEQNRRDEEENRRLYLEHLAHRQAEEGALAAQRMSHSNEQGSQQAYPSSYGRSNIFTPPNAHHSTSPQQIASTLDRAPSVASFAPSTSAANADATFYAQAIALGQRSALSEEKAEYLRQLRQGRQSNGSGPASPPPAPAPQGQQAVPTSYYHEAIEEAGSYSSPRTRDADPHSSRSRSTTPTPTAYRPPVAAQPSLTSSNGYKTAAEEKAEAAARRRAEDEARERFSSQASSVGLPEEEDFAPPSYPVPGSSVSSATPPPPRSAAEEKEELSAYYRAKQAVETQQQQPLPPPSRQPTAPPAARSPSQIGQAYPSFGNPDSNPNSHSNGFHHSPSAPPPLSHQPRSSESSSDLSHLRDPQVSLGKQRAESSSSSPPTSQPPYTRHVQAHTQAPSAPPPPSRESPSNGYYSTNSAQREADGDRGRGEEGRVAGIGPEGFGSFHLETQFPEFDRIAERIRIERGGPGRDQ